MAKHAQEIALPYIRFKYLQTHQDSPHIHVDLTCYWCKTKGIVFGGYQTHALGRKKNICSDCAITAYQQKYGFKSREAAEARRRRMFDVVYLLTEIITDDYMTKHGLVDIEQLSKKDIEMLTGLSYHVYNTMFTKLGKIKLEETVAQAKIEKQLQLAWVRFQKKFMSEPFAH